MKTTINKYWSKFSLMIVLLSCCSITQAQNTLVLNGAITVLDGGTAGAPVYLVVNEANPNGITRLAGGGHIHSENQYNFVRWVSGATTGSYVFPFGLGGTATDYIPFTFNKTAGNSNIDMSTWATDIQNNPHPMATNVGAVTNMFGTADSVLFAIDRFWDIQATATADLTFSYLGIENTTSSPLDTVTAQHWNGAAWDPQVGPGNPGVIAGVGTAGPFVGQNTFSPWVLTVKSPCPTASIFYPSNYCETDTGSQAVVHAGDTTGVYSSAPAGLDLDTLTGSIIPSNSTPGTYTVYYTIDSALTCPTFIDSTTVTIFPTVLTNDVAAICEGDSILLGGAFQTIAGVYVDSLSTSNGCDSIVSTTLTINPIDTVPQITSICTGDSILLGGGFQNTAGVYYDTLTNSNGCDSILATTLTIDTAITSTIIDSICQGQIYTLPGGDTTSIAGNYVDTLQATAGCDSIVTTMLSIITPPIIIASVDLDTICPGLVANLSASGGTSYTWNQGLGVGQTHPVSPASTTTYTVVGSDANGCTATDSVTVTVLPGTIANAGTDITVCEGDLVNLTGNTPLVIGETGLWTTNSIGVITTPTNPLTTVTGLTLGSYYFTWTISNASCPPSSDSVMVTIESCEPSVLIIPNVFTPNGDGQNDFFTIDGVNIIEINCQIFNRWGQHMYAWDNVNGAWDGRTTAGTEVPDGTYFYIIEALGSDGTEYFQKGAFSLIR